MHGPGGPHGGPGFGGPPHGGFGGPGFGGPPHGPGFGGPGFYGPGFGGPPHGPHDAVFCGCCNIC